MAEENPPVLRAPEPEPPKAPPAAAPLSGGLSFFLRLALLLNAKAWPLWLKLLVGVPGLVVAVFYFRDQRVGDGFFAPPVPAWTAVLFEDERCPLKIAAMADGRIDAIYGNGSKFAADGLMVALFTWQDAQATPEQAAVFKEIKEADYPLVVWLNASGFDVTGAPVVARAYATGRVLYTDLNYRGEHTALSLPLRGGGFRHFDRAGRETVYAEADWLSRVMRLAAETPAPPLAEQPKEKAKEAPKSKDAPAGPLIRPVRPPEER